MAVSGDYASYKSQLEKAYQDALTNLSTHGMVIVPRRIA